LLAVTCVPTQKQILSNLNIKSCAIDYFVDKKAIFNITVFGVF
jgi:hypothetical protein